MTYESTSRRNCRLLHVGRGSQLQRRKFHIGTWVWGPGWSLGQQREEWDDVRSNGNLKLVLSGSACYCVVSKRMSESSKNHQNLSEWQFYWRLWKGECWLEWLGLGYRHALLRRESSKMMRHIFVYIREMLFFRVIQLCSVGWYRLRWKN